MNSKHITNVISRAFGSFASAKHPKFLQSIINRSYASIMKLDLSEFESADSYPTLVALFTRELKKEREFDKSPDAVISPCDSFITECGVIDGKTLMQIKGMSYTLDGLLEQDDVSAYDGKSYINLYLSPSDYHRYHAPLDLHLTKLTHIPGKLYPVNIPFLRKKPNLFIENERVIIEGIDTHGKAWQLVFVGALNVGKMRFTHLAGLNTNISTAQKTIFNLGVDVKKGELLGWFEMGSTIVIIAPHKLDLIDGLLEKKVKFAESLGWIRA